MDPLKRQFLVQSGQNHKAVLIMVNMITVFEVGTQKYANQNRKLLIDSLCKMCKKRYSWSKIATIVKITSVAFSFGFVLFFNQCNVHEVIIYFFSKIKYKNVIF